MRRLRTIHAATGAPRRRDLRRRRADPARPASASSSRTRQPIRDLQRDRQAQVQADILAASRHRRARFRRSGRRRSRRSTRSGSTARSAASASYDRAGTSLAGYGRDGAEAPRSRPSRSRRRAPASSFRVVGRRSTSARRADRHRLSTTSIARPLSRRLTRYVVHRPARRDGGAGHRRARHRAGRAAPRQPRARASAPRRWPKPIRAASRADRGARQGRGPAAPEPEDAGARPADRRHRARFQQSADRHPGLGRHAAPRRRLPRTKRKRFAEAIVQAAEQCRGR